MIYDMPLLANLLLEESHVHESTRFGFHCIARTIDGRDGRSA